MKEKLVSETSRREGMLSAPLSSPTGGGGTGAVEELRGSGMAMGIDGDHVYEQYVKEDLTVGQIILMGTDGIWEAQNARGEMFGKETLYRIIQQYSDADAKGLLTACLYALDKFRDGVKPEDDVTLVVVKVVPT